MKTRLTLLAVLFVIVLLAAALPPAVQAGGAGSCYGITRAAGTVLAVRPLYVQVEAAGYTAWAATLRKWRVGQGVTVNASVCDGSMTVTLVQR